MTRNWGIPPKDGRLAFRHARQDKPFLTIFVTGVFGVIGAAIAVISFNEARALLVGLFRGLSLIAAVAAAGFGAWSYIWAARARFAAHFTGSSDAFSDILRFYARAALALAVFLAIGLSAHFVMANVVAVMLLCVSGGAAAAAAFQTLIAFVPGYIDDGSGDTRL